MGGRARSLVTLFLSMSRLPCADGTGARCDTVPESSIGSKLTVESSLSVDV